MPFPRILPAAEADILTVRTTTLSDYGPAKLAEYDDLLEEALEALTENPRAVRGVHRCADADRIRSAQGADAHK
jgi:plasmid stabilization system protein ParE